MRQLTPDELELIAGAQSTTQAQTLSPVHVTATPSSSPDDGGPSPDPGPFSTPPDC